MDDRNREEKDNMLNKEMIEKLTVGLCSIFSIVDIEQDKLDKWGDVLPFYKNIQKEGIVLWKAA